MDFLDPKKRRAHTVRLFIGYGLVGVALLIGTGILALAAYGFDVNRKTGAVIQNGLVFVDAHPESANIFINGIDKGKTDKRLVMPESNYSIELRRTGYRTWKNSFQLSGGSIIQLVYPVLFPEKIVSKDLKSYPSIPAFLTGSPDRRWLIIQSPTNFNQFDQYDLNASSNDASSFNLPTNLLTAATGPQSLELVEWSSDDRRFITKHIYPGGIEYILIDRASPESSQNLTKLYNQPGVQFSLRDKKYDQYYLYNPIAQTLQTTDLKIKQLTTALNGVIAFKSHGSNLIIYATNTPTTTDKILVRVKSGQDTYTLGQLAKANNYLIDLAQFDGHWYMVAGSPSDGRIYIYQDPADQIKSNKTSQPSPLLVLKQPNPTFLSFSENTRFISVQSGGLFAVYDLETKRSIHFDSGLALPAEYKASWMDGHRLTAASNGKAAAVDFDNSNKQSLVDVMAGYAPVFDREYKAMFTISPSLSASGKPALIRTELKVLPKQTPKSNN